MAGARATLKDVAREAGFSVMTVSHVLNGNKLNHASPRSRQVILEAARRLNYRPNLNARQLVTRKSNVIGLFLDSMSPNFYRDVMMELEHLAFAAGYRLQVGLLHNNLEAFKQYVDDFRGSGVENVICLAHAYPDFGSHIPALLEEFEHVVFMEEPLAETRFPVVAADHYRNYREIVAQLLAGGYRRIISPRSDYQDQSFCQARRGMADAYAEAGVAFDERFWFICDREWWTSEEEAAAHFDALLELEPDALILGNDESMFWSLRALQRRELSVPEDLGLFSANLWNYGRAAIPSFSGIDYNAPELARHLIDQLFADLNDEVAAPRERIASRIIWGESCPGRRSGKQR